MNIEHFANQILNKPILLKNEPWVKVYIHEMMDKYHDEDVRLHMRGEKDKIRTEEELYRDAQKGVLEFALGLFPNFVRGPLEHDKTNPETYAYDCINYQDPTNLVTFEVKRLNGTYFNYPRNLVAKMEKRIPYMDYLVAGEFIRVNGANEDYLCTFHFICIGDTFMKYMINSHKNPYGMYYAHKPEHSDAQMTGQCIVTEKFAK
jgi:hypothetical protein